MTGISNSTTKAQLKSFVERIESLEEQKAAIAGDIGDVYDAAKGEGFDKKALRAVIRLRKQDANDRRDFESALATYMHALGMEGENMEAFAALPRKDTEYVEAAMNGGAH